MAYAVPKLTDFSAASLDKAAAELLSALEGESAAVQAEADWKTYRDRWMARKDGILTVVNDWLKTAPKDSKRDVGQRVNEIKARVEQTVDVTLQRIQSGATASRLESDRLDITLPGIQRPIGA